MTYSRRWGQAGRGFQLIGSLYVFNGVISALISLSMFILAVADGQRREAKENIIDEVLTVISRCSIFDVVRREKKRTNRRVLYTPEARKPP